MNYKLYIFLPTSLREFFSPFEQNRNIEREKRKKFKLGYNDKTNNIINLLF